MTRNRQTPRRKRRFRITIDRAPSFTIDIGGGGFCTELMRVLAAGTSVEGSIRDEGGKDLTFAGRVVSEDDGPGARIQDARVEGIPTVLVAAVAVDDYQSGRFLPAHFGQI